MKYLYLLILFLLILSCDNYLVDKNELDTQIDYRLDSIEYINDRIETGERDIILGDDTYYLESRSFREAYIYIGDEILNIRGEGVENTIVKRRDSSILGDGYTALRPSPADATTDELNNAQWFIHDGIEYCIIIRGEVYLSDFTLDCNMWNQNTTNGMEHASTITVSGRIQRLPDGRGVILAFKKFDVKNVHVINNGVSDAFWITRSYSVPNIEQVNFTNITEDIFSRKGSKRATIGFSQTVKELNVKNCDIHRLELEGNYWNNTPGFGEYSGDYTSFWNVSNSHFRILDIAKKGRHLWLDAKNIISDISFLYQLGGIISNSKIGFNGIGNRLNRFKDFEFNNCDIIIEPTANNFVKGVTTTSQYGIGSDVVYNRCTFIITESDSIYGRIIAGAGADSIEEGSFTTLINCNYPSVSLFESNPDLFLGQQNTYGVMEFISLKEELIPFLWHHPFPSEKYGTYIINERKSYTEFKLIVE